MVVSDLALYGCVGRTLDVSPAIVIDHPDRRASDAGSAGELAFTRPLLEFVEDDDRCIIVLIRGEIALRTDVEPERWSTIPLPLGSVIRDVQNGH